MMGAIPHAGRNGAQLGPRVRYLGATLGPSRHVAKSVNEALLDARAGMLV